MIKYIRQNGAHRHLDKPFLVSWLNTQYNKLFPPQAKSKRKDVIYEESTVFFRRRMAAAFPGCRGLVEFTKAGDIHRHLSKLLETPLRFDESVVGATDPVWWFRGGSALDITSYKRIGWRRFVLGWEELKIKRIMAFVDNGRYYSNYVYVEAKAQKPTKVNRKDYSKEHIAELKKHMSYVDEEYAIYKPCCLFRKLVTKQEDDDGATTIFGKPIHMKRQHIETRSRFLTDYNFIIAAKGSAFNSQEFNRTSEGYFDGLLEGRVSDKQFNEFLMRFPKRDWEL